MVERPQIEQAIAALEAQPDGLPQGVFETSLAVLQQALERLTQQEAEASALHGERKQVTVMFADISGFTAMSEKLDPEEVRSLINDCFERLGAVIDRYDGHIDKFIGDEIMALFGAPIAHENDPERALRSALDMMQTLEAFNVEHSDRIPKPLALHFGINSGLVIAGGIGTRERQDYSVMGDT
ncbi:MAG: adenylate/guanylate cyclase domain-containing protein, partial [Chloroflexota bacterium]